MIPRKYSANHGAGAGAIALLRLLLLCLGPSIAAASPGLDAFLASAKERRLDTMPGWVALGRWSGHAGSWKGGIDGGYFYLDPQGRADPARELEATIRAVASRDDLSPYANDTTPVRLHPLVKYRARLRFLRAHGLPDSILPSIDTSRWVRWHDGVRPRSATLVYASSYLGNPASMFGHVLLRFDAPDRTGLKDRLNYGITYGAGMPPGDPLYIPKGLFGLYPGFLTILPYYLSLQKYKYLESRDLWEYPLALDSLETEKLLEIVWEGGAGWNRYYFFTENCATGLARLLDVLQPDSTWTHRFASPSMPPELVRLMHDRGFAGTPTRRPSQLATFLARRDSLNPVEQASLRRLVDGDLSDTLRWDASNAARILDAGIDYLGWRKRNHPRDSTWRIRQEALLWRRAALHQAPAEVDFSRHDVLPPEAGHRPRLLQMHAGSRQGSPEVGLLARLTYHSLEERPDGYLDGSEVEAGLLDASWVTDEGRDGFRLNRADILRIRSLPLWDPWLRDWAWSLRFGVRPFGLETMPWAGAEIGRGIAVGSRTTRLWALVSARASAAPWDEASAVTAGPAAAAGFLVSTRPMSIGLEAEWFEGWPTRKSEALLELSLRASLASAIDLDLRAATDPDLEMRARAGVGWHL